MTSEPCFAEVSLNKKSLELINRAVYEVVVLKPVKDSLTYERPLPLDLLPYIERTDKYRSVGTAFAISPTEFITASHVLGLGKESEYKDYSIRDAKGTLYAIDKILKYSGRRDFVVFTVKDRAAGDYLSLNANPELNSKVYAVGNALGEGIVIRDGLYTSNTPEDLKGEWKWLRFSAAASPGNSGGPLLDESGSVVGVILRKSPNENLNIALPVEEVMKAKAGMAHIYKKMVYFLDNMPMTKIDTLEQEIPLPKPYQQLSDEINSMVDQFGEKLLKKLLSENQAQIFPSGADSNSLLNKHYHENSPRLIMKGDDGTWDAYAPNTRDLELGHNGLVTLGALKNTFLLRIRKPDDIPLATFHGNSKVFMDALLKGLGITREVGPDKVKITSLGKAKDDSIFVDQYERKWLVRTWIMEYNDVSIVSFSLPVPGGCITLMRIGPTSHTSGQIMDLKVLADFIYASYGGSLKQWNEFLTMKKLMPRVLAAMDISFEYGKRVAYKSGRLAFSLDQTNMNITENSELHLSFGYFKERNSTLWDVEEIMVAEDKNSVTSYKLTRFTKPPRDLNDADKSTWEKLTARKIPYNRTAYVEDNSTKIMTAYTGNIPEAKLATAEVLYNVGYRKEGAWGQKEMEDALGAFQTKVSIFEDIHAK